MIKQSPKDKKLLNQYFLIIKHKSTRNPDLYFLLPRKYKKRCQIKKPKAEFAHTLTTYFNTTDFDTLKCVIHWEHKGKAQSIILHSNRRYGQENITHGIHTVFIFHFIS